MPMPSLKGVLTVTKLLGGFGFLVVLGRAVDLAFNWTIYNQVLRMVSQAAPYHPLLLIALSASLTGIVVVVARAVWLQEPDFSKRVLYTAATTVALCLVLYVMFRPQDGTYFNPMNGQPEMKYARDPDGAIRLFSKEHQFDPKYGGKLLPVTAEIVREYEAGRSRPRATAESRSPHRAKASKPTSPPKPQVTMVPRPKRPESAKKHSGGKRPTAPPHQTGPIQTAVSQTVKPPPPPRRFARLDSLERAGREGAMGCIQASIDGKVYKNVLAIAANLISPVEGVYADYILRREFRTFRCVVGVCDKASERTELTYVFYGDGRELERVGPLKVGMRPVGVEIDVTNVLRFKVLCEGPGLEATDAAYWIEPTVYRH